MIVEIAHFCLVMAFVVACFNMLVPMWGSFYQNSVLTRFARPATLLQFVLVLFSFAGLVYAFATDDFSVAYVASHSYTKLPMVYKLTAAWGAHEGSLLLWIVMLSGWAAAVSIFSRTLPDVAVARVLAVMAIISVGFLSFALFTSNPFERLLPNFPIDGRDLNPLLQDFGFIVHPPFLYMGYVGFAVVFAFAVAALITGELDSAWARWSRPWAVLAWVFLTIGIALGSWWAYYELGWGGWWFWDPVENASFMPWLTGTALIHTLAVSEKRGVFKTWTVFLALLTFCLSLLGTFIVRSGVITSVHSFAQDPVRGLYILIFLGIVVVGSLILFMLRGAAVQSTGRFSLFSKEAALLGNNLLLVFACLVVLFGTLYPLINEAFDKSVSVGAPYFNTVFPVVMIPLMILLGFGHWMHWKNQKYQSYIQQLRRLLIINAALLIGIAVWLHDYSEPMIWLGVIISSWIVSSILQDIREKTRHGNSLISSLAKLKPAYWGMHVAHLGLAVSLVGIVMVSFASRENLISLAIGETYNDEAFSVTFEGVRQVQGPNYMATRGHFILNEGHREFNITSDKRRYTASGQVMTEAGIQPGLSRDIYISLGEPLDDKNWSVRIYRKAYVRWIWLGAFIMSLGGAIAISDRRYRLKLKNKFVKKQGGQDAAVA
ncbi:heme lyase CcmF/NrfE family subunit [Pleionea litopenaei]|uniref:Heme lyase CcmF/NrfE family subunit n=1 Tax=Pleionea litopenaei TaxID=3070815 RepID=A0AA51RV49_9GAMM|nr:heme lyase CcmF/NrfE family subunit [Pleionea sp. HL-JVS1]WMS88152.1 heme lyase CcmF/NrfE family subunit [Pleionea sp. HL-JVS1]